MSKIILKKKTLKELNMKRIPRKLKKIYKKFIGAGQVFAEIFDRENALEIYKDMELDAARFASVPLCLYRENL